MSIRLSPQKVSRVLVSGLAAGLLFVAGTAWGTGSGSRGVEQSSVAEQGLYLVIDMLGSEISLRLAEVRLREHDFTLVSDSGETAKFVNEWSKSTSGGQTVESVHLLSAATTISEAELQIINEETALEAEEIQRYLPGQMLLITSDGLRIYVETDCPNAESFTWEKVREFFRRIWYGLTAGGSLRVRMSAVDAMSLYGAARTKPRVMVRP